MLNVYGRLTTGLALSALVVGLLGSSARAAVVIAPGATVTTPADTFGTTVGVGDTATYPASTEAGSTTSGSYIITSAPFTTTPANSGYDFLYQLKNTGSTTITTIDITSFTGYTTLVSYLTNSAPGFTTGTVATTTATRDANGSGITFTFAGGGLAPGATSDVLYLHALSASLNNTGTSFIYDGTTGTSSSLWQPAGAAVSVPEPSSIALLGCFATVGGIGAFLRRRAARKVA
jgi:hypothetical protein